MPCVPRSDAPNAHPDFKPQEITTVQSHFDAMPIFASKRYTIYSIHDYFIAKPTVQDYKDTEVFQ